MLLTILSDVTFSRPPVFSDSTIKIELTKQDPQLNWSEVSKSDLTFEATKIKREAAVDWRHEYEARKAKEKLVNGRLREKSATESSLDALEENRKNLKNQKDKAKAGFFREEETYIPAQVESQAFQVGLVK
jgi:hypothetical protein